MKVRTPLDTEMETPAPWRPGDVLEFIYAKPKERVRRWYSFDDGASWVEQTTAVTWPKV